MFSDERSPKLKRSIIGAFLVDGEEVTEGASRKRVGIGIPSLQEPGPGGSTNSAAPLAPGSPPTPGAPAPAAAPLTPVPTVPTVPPKSEAELITLVRP